MQSTRWDLKQPTIVSNFQIGLLINLLLEFLLTKSVPGPGAYEAKPAINDKGNYFISKFRNSSATSIDPPSSARFKDLTSKLRMTRSGV